jgi:AraC family transcriptional regulator of adaptative response / DNA-3-methyladenine glycosylase II
MPRLASAAADRIALGALNTQPVASLASDLCVSERHLRRAVKRELGVTPTELAQTHRLLMAKRLLADTKLDMSRIAFASGFQSLRRFNAVVRERYGMAPTALRRATRSRPASRRGEADRGPTGGPVELTLAYRPPLAWSAMLEHLAEHATPGVERVDGRSYARTVRIEDRTGVVVMQDDASRSEIRVRIPPALVPALMPLLAALRRLLDLDAEPSVIDARLAESGLGAHVEGCRGLRVPGAVDGFEHAVLAIVHDAAPGGHGRELAAALVRDLGGPVEHGEHGLDRIAPDAARLAEEGESKLTALGLPARHAKAVASLARSVAGGSLRLSPGCDPTEVRDALLDIDGIGPALALRIVMRSLSWPDAFPADVPALHRACGASRRGDLLRRADAWRPWRAYAALHLRRLPTLPVG